MSYERPKKVTYAVIESPFAGKTEVERARNMAYLRAAMADCFSRGEVPFASHALYTQPGVLDDTKPEERQKGILAGFCVADALHHRASYHSGKFIRAFYEDRGWSTGMVDGIEDASYHQQARERRRLGPEWSKEKDHLYYLDLKGELRHITPPAKDEPAVQHVPV